MNDSALREGTSRAAPPCDTCHLGLDAPGVMIARGRIVMHIACDTAVTPSQSP
jgi:hypothetical protein